MMFTVTSERVAAVSEALAPEYQIMYVEAWRDGISAVMGDLGWTYEVPHSGVLTVVERIRTGLPRVMHGIEIERQLASAARAVENALDSVLSSSYMLNVIDEVRASFPVMFEWNIIEASHTETEAERDWFLLGSSYIDLTVKDSMSTHQ